MYNLTISHTKTPWLTWVLVTYNEIKLKYRFHLLILALLLKIMHKHYSPMAYECRGDTGTDWLKTGCPQKAAQLNN